MEAINGYKIFMINECEWYKARNIYEAIDTAMNETGLSFQEACDAELHELSDAEAETLMYVDLEDNLNSEKMPFKLRLEWEMDNLPVKPGIFASTEY